MKNLTLDQIKGTRATNGKSKHIYFSANTSRWTGNAAGLHPLQESSSRRRKATSGRRDGTA